MFLHSQINHTDMTELWLCNNRIEILPPEIGSLKNLTILSIKGNLLDSIPDEICLLEKLKILYVNDNKIRKLPNLMESLKKLVDLDIKNNKFDSFPDVVCTLRSLVHLNISENNFDNIPMKFSRLRSLINLNLTSTTISGDCSVLFSMFWVDIIGYNAILLQRSSHTIRLSKIILKSQLSSENPSMPDIDKSVKIISNSGTLTSITSPVQGNNVITRHLGRLEDCDEDMGAFLRNRASCRIAAKLRRRKGKRSSMSSPSKPSVVARLPLLL